MSRWPLHLPLTRTESNCADSFSLSPRRHDTELTDLIPFLADLGTVEDVRSVLDANLYPPTLVTEETTTTATTTTAGNETDGITAALQQL